jgi:signal transduction histidine kinase
LSGKATPILTPQPLEPLSPSSDGQPWRERIELVRLTAHLSLPGSEGAPCPARASIAVRDRGVGISQEDKARVFQPFYRADPLERNGSAGPAGKPSGAGLGLTIARGLVEWHGGLRWVESCQGKGSTFGFCLPLHPPADLPRELLSPQGR